MYFSWRVSFANVSMSMDAVAAVNGTVNILESYSNQSLSSFANGHHTGTDTYVAQL
jgi:hypothetical protein